MLGAEPVKPQVIAHQAGNVPLGPHAEVTPSSATPESPASLTHHCAKTLLYHQGFYLLFSFVTCHLSQ